MILRIFNCMHLILILQPITRPYQNITKLELTKAFD